MRRKIIPHGPSSLTVSLPARWVKQHSLKKGGELDISEEDNNLIIRPIGTNSGSKNTEVSIAGLDQETWKSLLLTLHKKGYDEIKISFDSPGIVKDLHAHLNSMQLGLEIIRQEAGFIVLRNISNPGSEQLDNLMRRVFRITLEYSNKIGAIVSDREDRTQSCLYNEISVSRISNYCKRIVIKDKHPDSCFIYAILDDLNMIVKSLTSLLNEINESETLPEQLPGKIHETSAMLSRIYGIFYKFSLEEYSAARKDLDALVKQIAKLRLKDRSCCWDHLISVNSQAGKLMESILALQY